MAASAACWWASRLEYPEPEPTTVPLIAAEAVKMGLWALSADVPVIVNSQERCRFCAHSRSVDLKFSDDDGRLSKSMWFSMSRVVKAAHLRPPRSRNAAPMNASRAFPLRKQLCDFMCLENTRRSGSPMASEIWLRDLRLTIFARALVRKPSSRVG